MKKIRSILLLVVMMLAATVVAQAATLKGKVIDSETKEPLLGAMVFVMETNQGTTTDLDGAFELKVKRGTFNLEISYISYVTQVVAVDANAKTPELLFELVSDSQTISEVVVSTRKNLEAEATLQNERIASNVAIENMGAKEMSIKGISNVEEGVKKLTGISVENTGQLIVRGLGDRYSTTTLNGLPIASPNPDNKLVPLSIFPSSTVKNITVSKVYDVAEFADYSGAHIDIATKDMTSDRLFNIGFSVGGDVMTVGRDFYQMDNVSMFSMSRVGDAVLDPATSHDEVLAKDSFDTSFDAENGVALPDFSGNIAWGNSYDIASQTLSFLASGSIGNKKTYREDSMERKITSEGKVTDEFESDEYLSELDMTMLFNASMTMRESDRISYNMFYARQASNEFQRREGFGYDKANVVTANNVSHIYKLLTQQLIGAHDINEKLGLDWSVGYTTTSSDEPDRREVLFVNSGDNLDIENHSAMRFFGYLAEQEMDADVSTDYAFSDNASMKLGFAYKSKYRDYENASFFYKANAFRDEKMEDIYSADQYLNHESLANGDTNITTQMRDVDKYQSHADVYAAYLSIDLTFAEKMNVNLGVRAEASEQSVDYTFIYPETSELNNGVELFPAVNLKYNFSDKNIMRFSASRTVTRPSFIEMAEFDYSESFGSATIRGNAELQNGYNYNLDLRYENFSDKGDMFSFGAYYKRLDSPIERVQTISGEDAVIQTFENVEMGEAFGIEFEMRKKIIDELRLGVNGSYMYTNVSLSDAGTQIYTNDERMLQGASPYLVNADLTYTLNPGEEKQLNLALLYNLQGERIYAVGLNGFGDIMQQAVNTLNFVASYSLSKKVDLKLELTDILNHGVVFEQQLPSSTESVVVKSYNPGMGAQIGVTIKL